MEIYKDIKDYEGIYQVSNYGNVKSLERLHAKGKGVLKERILKPSLMSSGYYQVILCRLLSKKAFTIHRLVANSFITKKQGKEIINHIDGNKRNNSVENLEWCTYRENSAHGYMSKKTTSIYTGVSLTKNKNWLSVVTIYDKNICIGVFESEYFASVAYNKISKLTEWYSINQNIKYFTKRKRLIRK
jgi:hypothetical protein